MRPVLLEDPSELDSIVMTISHSAVAIQAFRALGRSELKRVMRPQFWNPHPSQEPRTMGHPQCALGVYSIA
jgi:hypothetical protein